MPVDPFITRTPLLVTTASGARHLVVPGEVGTVTITRLAPHNPDAHSGTCGRLRRDGEPLQLGAVTHLEAGRFVNGILEGVEMCLEVEPLRPDAAVTLRLSTKVVSVQPLPAATDTDLVEPHGSERAGSATDASKPPAIQVRWLRRTGPGSSTRPGDDRRVPLLRVRAVESGDTGVIHVGDRHEYAMDVAWVSPDFWWWIQRVALSITPVDDVELATPPPRLPGGASDPS